jgi:hypothetical protein
VKGNVCWVGLLPGSATASLKFCADSFVQYAMFELYIVEDNQTTVNQPLEEPAGDLLGGYALLRNAITLGLLYL